MRKEMFGKFTWNFLKYLRNIFNKNGDISFFYKITHLIFDINKYEVFPENVQAYNN